MKVITNRTGAALVLCALFVLSAASQPTQVLPGREAGLALEVLRPRFESDDIALGSVAVFLSGRYPISRQADLVAELPVSRFEADFGGEDESEAALGNPYIGLEVGPREAATYVEAGVRLPLVSNENSGIITGLLSDIDRLEAFLPDAVAASGAVNYAYEPDGSGLRVRLRAGPDVWIFTEDEFDENDALELFLRYGAHAWYDAGRVRLGGALSGRLIATEDDLSLADRTLHQAILSVTADVGGIRPGFHLRIPFDYGEDEGPDYVLGLSLAEPL